MIHFENEWDELLREEFQKPYYLALRAFLKSEYNGFTVYPDMFDIFNALKYTSYGDVKAVILGQDPYHEPGQAHGLAFSVPDGIDLPPSLRNIYKELSADLGVPVPTAGCLIPWARQGVLLLNTSLTVRRGQANSHRGQGWEIFTDRIISILNEREKPVVFILWGANARAKTQLITNPRHCILQSAHPSPLSAHNGFFGSRPFSKCNAFLEANGMKAIDWVI